MDTLMGIGAAVIAILLGLSMTALLLGPPQWADRFARSIGL